VPRTVNDVNWTWDTLNDKNGNDIIEGNPEGLSWNMKFPYGQLAYPGSNRPRYGCEAMGAWVQLFGGNVYPGVTINWKTGWNSATDRTYLGNNTIADYGWEFSPGNSRAALLAVLPVRDHY
jgi:hypothetical protein